MKPVDISAEQVNHIYKCNQWDYKYTNEKGLGMHMRMNQIISQVDQINESDDDTSEETEIGILRLDDLDCNEDEGTEKVKTEETFSFKMGKDGYP